MTDTLSHGCQQSSYRIFANIEELIQTLWMPGKHQRTSPNCVDAQTDVLLLFTSVNCNVGAFHCK